MEPVAISLSAMRVAAVRNGITPLLHKSEYCQYHDIKKKHIKSYTSVIVKNMLWCIPTRGVHVSSV